MQHVIKRLSLSLCEFVCVTCLEIEWFTRAEINKETYLFHPPDNETLMGKMGAGRRSFHEHIRLIKHLQNRQEAPQMIQASVTLFNQRGF